LLFNVFEIVKQNSLDLSLVLAVHVVAIRFAKIEVFYVKPILAFLLSPLSVDVDRLMSLI